MEARYAHRGADFENERKLEEGVASGGRPRVPRRAARGTQQLFPRARRKGDKTRADVGEADGGSESEPVKQREAGAGSEGQRKIRGPLQEPADVYQTGVTSEKGAQGERVRPRALDGAVPPIFENRKRLRADEQVCVRKNDGNPQESCGREDYKELGRRQDPPAGGQTLICQV